MNTLEPDKYQTGDPPAPTGLAPDVVVSPDTLRGQRIPPHQSRTRKWPVLDASGPPRLELSTWELRVFGAVEAPLRLSWDQFHALPRTKVFADMHCVTRWSRLGNLWEGVGVGELMARVRPRPEAKFVLVHGADRGWTTNLPIEEFLAQDVLFADTHDGAPISIEHGGPLRLVVPRLYAWKSAKWVTGIELRERDTAGYWERLGYHMHGDPWKEERYGF